MSTTPDWFRSLVTQPDRSAAAIDLARGFICAVVAERETILAGWPFSVEWPYPDPARLGCSHGEAASPRDRIMACLVLEYLEGMFGSREHLIALSATYRSCELANLDPAAVFEEAAAVLDNPAAAWLRSFLKRSKSDRELRAFGLVERRNQDGEVEIHLAQ